MPVELGRAMSESARLVAPVAVRLVHLDLPLGPVDLPRASGGGEYRSLLAILCRQGRPLGSVIVPAGRGLVTASTLGAAVDRSRVRLDSVAA